MTRYLVEAYAPVTTVIAEVIERAREAARESSRAGSPVRHLRSILIREDETCFHVFEAASVADVRWVAQLARLDPQRIVEAEP